MKAKALKYVVGVESTIEEAWSKIEENNHRSVIVVRGKKVVGALSDGDLRKAMLAKRLLTAPVRDVMNVNFFSISPAQRGKAKELFEKKNIFLIPVVDEKLNLLDVIARRGDAKE